MPFKSIKKILLIPQLFNGNFKVDPNFDWCCLFFCRYFMALMQEMAVKIDQGFLGAILALFNPATDSQDTKEKVTTAFC